VLEVVERIIVLAVVFIDFCNEVAELEGADFISFDDLSVAKHSPDVTVEFISILNQQIVYCCVFNTQEIKISVIQEADVCDEIVACSVAISISFELLYWQTFLLHQGKLRAWRTSKRVIFNHREEF